MYVIKPVFATFTIDNIMVYMCVCHNDFKWKYKNYKIVPTSFNAVVNSDLNLKDGNIIKKLDDTIMIKIILFGKIDSPLKIRHVCVTSYPDDSIPLINFSM